MAGPQELDTFAAGLPLTVFPFADPTGVNLERA
jgi:hypothetical protein